MSGSSIPDLHRSRNTPKLSTSTELLHLQCNNVDAPSPISSGLLDIPLQAQWSLCDTSQGGQEGGVPSTL